MFSGEMPPSMSDMLSLNDLDVSFNNLSGRVPSSTQLQSFEPTRFTGNAGLCGPPITKKCPGDEHLGVPHVVKSESDGYSTDETQRWFYVGGASGFATGFCIVCSVLLLNRQGRRVFFHVHDSIEDWVIGTQGSHVQSDTVSSLDKEWSRLNDLVKVWILGTCCESLQDQVVSTPGTAKDLWDHIKDLFHDNEDARAIALDNQLRSVNIDKNLVIYALNGLDSRYKHIAKIIRHTKPLPTFATTKTMLLLEETELKDEGSLDRTHVDSSASSPTVLLAPNKNNGNRAHDQNSSKGTNGQPTQFYNYFSKAQHAQFLAAAQLALQAALLAQAQQPSYSAHNQSTTAGILGPAPNMIPTTETTLPSAFSTMTLQDPTWNMDTGASSHLNSNSSNLSTIFNKRLC
ncbi:hybrid signal transduction histidine kinase M [Tanacetum coccineum]